MVGVEHHQGVEVEGVEHHEVIEAWQNNLLQQKNVWMQRKRN